jgi:hypothetical protein
MSNRNWKNYFWSEVCWKRYTIKTFLKKNDDFKTDSDLYEYEEYEGFVKNNIYLKLNPLEK